MEDNNRYEIIGDIFKAWNETHMLHWDGVWRKRNSEESEENELYFLLKKSNPDFGPDEKKQLFIQQLGLTKFVFADEKLEPDHRAGLCKDFTKKLFEYCSEKIEIILQCVNTQPLTKFCETRGFKEMENAPRCFLIHYTELTDEDQKAAVKKSIEEN